MKVIVFLQIIIVMFIFGANLSLAENYDCTDSDGGLNAKEKGIVRFNGSEYRDACAYDGAVSRLNGVSGSAGDVMEFSCSAEDGSRVCNSGACLFSILKCPDGLTCNDGECIIKEDWLPKGVNCDDSDGGIEYDVRGVVKSQNGGREEDYCVTDKELREWYCDNTQKKPTQLSVTQCEGICACGRCFKKGEEANCKSDYQKYCNEPSCFVIQKDFFGEIKFVSQENLNECIVAKDCKVYSGKYSVDDYLIQTFVELNADIDFSKLAKVLRNKYGIAPIINDKTYVIDDGVTLFIYWISDKKIIHIEVPKVLIDKENDDVEEFVEEYLKAHPSDIQKNLNFFDKVINWFKGFFQ